MRDSGMTPRVFIAILTGMKTILPAIVIAVVLSAIALVTLQPAATVAQPATRAGGTVAVIDLDGIAATIGRAETIKNSITAKQTEFNTQLTAAQENINAQIKAKQAEYGEKPTAEQNQILQQMRSKGGSQLIQARQKAQILLQQHQTQVVNEFRNEVKPHAQAVAKEMGYLVVLVKNDQLVFTYAASADISDAVAAKMQAK